MVYSFSWRITSSIQATTWPPIILGLPSLFLEMSVCRVMYHGISILICPNMLCAMSVDSTCVRILWKLRQQRGLTMVLAYVTSVLEKMNMFRTRCMLFYFAKTIEFVSWGSCFPFCLHLFLRTFQQPNPFCWSRLTTNLFMISFLSRTLDFFFFFIWGWPRPVSSRSAKQPGWRSPPIVTIVTIVNSRSAKQPGYWKVPPPIIV